MYAYKIVGKNCGRDKNGNFICTCGKCEIIPTVSELQEEEKEIIRFLRNHPQNRSKLIKLLSGL